MTVYIEYVFLNNLAINYLICYLTLSAVREKLSVWRLLLAGGIGAVFSVFYPLMTEFTLYIKILLSLIMLLIIRKSYKDIKEFAVTAFVFFAITFAFAGAALMLENIAGFKSGLTPFAVSAGVLLSFVLIRYMVKALYERKKIKAYQYPVEVVIEKGAKECIGYYDSGNKLTDNGLPVVVISRGLSDSLALKRIGEIAVNTVGGVKMLPLVNLEYKIYYGNGGNKIYRTPAAVSDSFDGRGYDIILHRDMGGNDG